LPIPETRAHNGSGASNLPFHSHARALTVLVFFSALSLLPLACAADSATVKTLTPEELVRTLAARKGAKPLLFHVGSHMFFLQAHIPGSEYVGAGATAEGIQNLHRRVSGLPKKTSIVLYCGCCPWSHCPNVNPAYDALLQMGFTNVKVLFMANNFGADWVDKGYPVAKGE
jgi:thiosulfate/3-mercaptopyruvate sulfurtransferase